VTRINQEGIAGLNFAVTGEILTFKNRKELKAFIESCGGKLQSSVSAKTDYLIFNDISLFSWETQDTNGEKMQKAKELGIEIITELQLYEKAGKQYVPPAHNNWF
jgi:DNA ligase (NAD+)